MLIVLTHIISTEGFCLIASAWDVNVENGDVNGIHVLEERKTRWGDEI